MGNQWYNSLTLTNKEEYNMSILNGSLVVESQQESFINKVEPYQEPSSAEKLADMVLKINLANVTEDGSVGIGQGYLAMMREVAKEIKGI